MESQSLTASNVQPCPG